MRMGSCGAVNNKSLWLSYVCCSAFQTFQALCNTDAGFPPQLLQAGRSAYEATKQDVRFLLPCLPALEKEELRALLPQIVAMSAEDVVGAFRRILDVRAVSLSRFHVLAERPVLLRLASVCRRSCLPRRLWSRCITSKHQTRCRSRRCAHMAFATVA